MEQCPLRTERSSSSSKTSRSSQQQQQQQQQQPQEKRPTTKSTFRRPSRSRAQVWLDLLKQKFRCCERTEPPAA